MDTNSSERLAKGNTILDAFLCSRQKVKTHDIQYSERVRSRTSERMQ